MLVGFYIILYFHAFHGTDNAYLVVEIHTQILRFFKAFIIFLTNLYIKAVHLLKPFIKIATLGFYCKSKNAKGCKL